jgi:hypothetical protein
MDTTIFYQKLRAKQSNSLKWNAVIEDINCLYDYHFKEKIFTTEELWDFLFTKREDHFNYHVKIWNTFNINKYKDFFKIVYNALDDPDSEWWSSQYKEKLE